METKTTAKQRKPVCIYCGKKFDGNIHRKVCDDCKWLVYPRWEGYKKKDDFEVKEPAKQDQPTPKKKKPTISAKRYAKKVDDYIKAIASGKIEGIGV